MAGQREHVLLLAGDAVFVGDQLGALAQGHRPLRGHPGIDHPPAQRGGEHLLMPRGEGPFGLAQHIGRAAHRLHAARDRDMRIAVRDGAGRLDNRLQAGTAQPVDGHSGDGHRQPGQQHRHPRDVAVVLARPVGVAEDDVVDPRRIEVRGALHQGPDHMRGQIVGPDGGQGAAVLADGGPYRIDDIDIPYAWVGHLALSSLSRLGGGWGRRTTTGKIVAARLRVFARRCRVSTGSSAAFRPVGPPGARGARDPVMAVPVGSETVGT